MESPWHQFVDSIPTSSGIEVQISPLQETSEYPIYGADVRVERVLHEYGRGREISYLVRFISGQRDEITFSELLHLPGGPQAIEQYRARSRSSGSTSRSSRSSTMPVSLRPGQYKRKQPPGFVDSTNIDFSDDDSLTSGTRKRLRLVLGKPAVTQHYKLSSSESEGDSDQPRRAQRRSRHQARTREQQDSSELIELASDSSTETDESINFIDSFNRGRKPKRKEKHGPVRKSSRAGRNRTRMKELGEDDIPEAYVPTKTAAPKFTAMKEHFPEVSGDNNFRKRHTTFCAVCGDYREHGEKGPLVFCQGCIFVYHATCLGARNGRDHLVTKIGKRSFVLQCRRCIDHATKKDSTAPKHSRCQSCQTQGAAAKPFRARKSMREEQKEREENSGEDPITLVDPLRLNNVSNVLFRCIHCERAWHVHHLPPREESIFETQDEDRKAMERWDEYSEDWTCLECLNVPGRIGGLVAWRLKLMDQFVIGTAPEDVPEDDKEYLVKWDGKSYFASLWMPGAWIWKVASRAMVIAFFKRNNGRVPPISRTEDAIPEDFLRVDIVFKAEYNNIVADHIEEVDLARIREVDRALVKYKGLTHDDVVWDKPPNPVQDPERWKDFKDAYEDWVRGRYMRLPVPSTLSNHVRKVKALPFEEKVMLKEQPKFLIGGELMSYQLDGLNWLYYQWHHGQNAILADEMGLGKTIQVIGFLAVLQEKHHCWPFLIVVPNATVANWKREIKQWAPSLRVVTYFGSAKAIELAEKYELFRQNKKELACHVVVTSYDAAQTPSSVAVLRKIPWQALVVDEGQRLKNDKNLLYSALSQMRTPFKLLMTGTPLQNNQRELFNLLQFLDPKVDAEALETKYEILTKENMVELHEMLRPFFLRRTKAQVLTFLPTMAQIIVPVTMTGLQKHLYKTILAQNTELLRSIFGGDGRAPAKGGLRNILMQLRKCLCHPFVYNLAIEERNQQPAVSHRRLVEASSKLRLLEIMLPKLQERRHRVLIFSQFLDMLTIMEDFLQDLGLEHSRLDGSMSSMEKQKVIDKFNSPNSSVFAFLLSTRAGGVGINLATADTVIILDPDFNPHQDIQAISRAHRIGQKNKVLVFQLTTRMSAEEKIMQIGKKKMALDHALIDAMDADEETVEDLEAVLRYGAEALFKNDDSTDIHYDSESVDKLLDKSQVENTEADQNNSAESQFSFARVWQNESSSMAEGIGALGGDGEGSGNVWDQLMAEKARQVEEDARKRAEKLGRGKRQRRDVDYHSEGGAIAAAAIEDEDKEDTDFQARESEDDSPDEDAGEQEKVSDQELADRAPTKVARSKLVSPPQPAFKRAAVPPVAAEPPPNARRCPACTKDHPVGSCPLKIAGPEYCGLCGLAHYSYLRTCPHMQSETQVRAMLQALENSPEPRELVNKARKLLHGIKGSIVQQNKRKEEAKQRVKASSSTPRPNAPVSVPSTFNPVYRTFVPLNSHSVFAPQPYPAPGYYGMAPYPGSVLHPTWQPPPVFQSIGPTTVNARPQQHTHQHTHQQAQQQQARSQQQAYPQQTRPQQ